MDLALRNDRAGRADAGGDRLDWPRRGLSRYGRTVARAALEAILADEDEGGRLVGARAEVCDRAVDEFDHAIGRANPDVRRAFRFLPLVLDLMPLLFVGAFGRMHKLPIERRVAYFEALEASKIGLVSMLFVAFKVPLCIPAFEEGEELRDTGFDRPTTVSRRKLPVEQSAATASAEAPP